MFFDQTTMEYWIDHKPEGNWGNWYEELVLIVSLKDYPEVTPVFKRIRVEFYCPPKHVGVG